MNSGENMNQTRNVLCPYYDTCLDNVVRKDIPGWDCADCEHRNKVAPIDPTEPNRCKQLLAKIFKTPSPVPELFNRQEMLCEMFFQ